MSENGTARKSAVVVVGVDGSAGAMAALRWALAEVRLRKVPLRVVHAWTDGMDSTAGAFGYMGGAGIYSIPDVDVRELQAAAERMVDRMIDDVGGTGDDLVIERCVVSGGAAAVLVSTATPDDLLVVGSRGRGGFATLLLGSVSQQCVHHASCPVVVVHSVKATTAEEDLVRSTPTGTGTPV